ncbi:MAG: hypothetical protein KAX49_01465 [Halanaerobiales bacterium]|nr:hypothetical protein [Halanaerobiales bacterium]
MKKLGVILLVVLLVSLSSSFVFTTGVKADTSSEPGITITGDTGSLLNLGPYWED